MSCLLFPDILLKSSLDSSSLASTTSCVLATLLSLYGFKHTAFSPPCSRWVNIWAHVWIVPVLGYAEAISIIQGLLIAEDVFCSVVICRNCLGVHLKQTLEFSCKWLVWHMVGMELCMGAWEVVNTWWEQEGQAEDLGSRKEMESCLEPCPQDTRSSPCVLYFPLPSHAQPKLL